MQQENSQGGTAEEIDAVRPLSRYKERELAFAVIFEKSFHPDEPAEEIYRQAIASQMLGHSDYVLNAAKGVYENLAEIDLVISREAQGWKINRLPRVTLAILRLAVYEMVYDCAIPTGVSINEAVELCKRFANKEDGQFVNGVLGTVAKTLDA
jgi:N utilization substance protein B